MAVTSIDLVKLQEAFDWLAENPEGDEALKLLSDSFDSFRGRLPVELNNAEVRYMLERLAQNRSLQDWDKKAEMPEVAGFDFRALGGLYPQQTGVSRLQLPEQLQRRGVRALNYGFNIRAAIAQL